MVSRFRRLRPVPDGLCPCGRGWSGSIWPGVSQNVPIDRGNSPAVRNAPRLFATTHWSVVLAVQDEDPDQAARALESLCQSYWPPLYSYLRRAGFSPEDAEDLIQGFFQEILALHALHKVAPGRGRFRSFLMACLKKYVAAQRQRARRQKRGGGRVSWSVDLPGAEAHYSAMLYAQTESPDDVYEREWASTVVARVLARLRAEAVERGQESVFEHLKSSLVGDRPGVTYHDLADRLKLSEGAIKMVAMRLRERCGALFREEIAQTVENPAEIESEITHLFEVFGRRGG